MPNYKTALFFKYGPPNKYSCNVLAGALLQAGFPGELFFLEKDYPQALQRESAGFDRVVAAFSFFTPQLPETEALLHRVLKVRQPHWTLMAGGPHPSGDPEGALNMGFDAVVRGEGEAVFCGLMERIAAGEAVKGVFSAEQPVTLDDYPPFAASLKRFNPIEITRGCFHACRFCETPSLHRGRVRHRSVENIVTHVKTTLDRNIKDIRFISANAFGYGSTEPSTVNLHSLEALLAGCRELAGKQARVYFGSFPSEVRPEHVNDQTVGLVRKYADNDSIIVGAQSGSERILRGMRRGHTVEDVYGAVEVILSHGLTADADFMFGLPGETEDDVLETLRVMKDLAADGARIHGHTFMPLAGTPLYGSPAGVIPESIKPALQELQSRGVLYGQWEKQERLSAEIAARVSPACNGPCPAP